MAEWTVALPEAWGTAEFDPHFCEVIAEAELPRGRSALVVMAMLVDGTNLLALAWDRGTRLARMAPPDWKLEERFTGRPPGPGEGLLIKAWAIGLDCMLKARGDAERAQATDPEWEDRARALRVARTPEMLDAAWAAYQERDDVPAISRDDFAEALNLYARGGAADA